MAQTGLERCVRGAENGGSNPLTPIDISFVKGLSPMNRRMFLKIQKAACTCPNCEEPTPSSFCDFCKSADIHRYEAGQTMFRKTWQDPNNPGRSDLNVKTFKEQTWCCHNCGAEYVFGMTCKLEGIKVR